MLSIVCKTLEEKNGGPVKLAFRRGDPLAQPRANAVNAANIKQYYDLLKETLKKNGIFNSPNRIWNMECPSTISPQNL